MQQVKELLDTLLIPRGVAIVKVESLEERDTLEAKEVLEQIIMPNFNLKQGYDPT